METEDLINLPASSNSDHQSENDDLHNSYCEPSDADSQPSNLEVKKDNLNGMTSGTADADADAGNEDNSQLALAADTDVDLEGSSSIFQASVELNETVAVPEDVEIFVSGIQTENGGITVQDGSPISNRKRDGSLISNHEIDDNSISGVKKAKIIVDELQPSVHVVYNSLSRESKQKLEELLQQWSEWHAQHCSSSHARDSNEVLESGEETYFPALCVGLDNSSAVSFWMDNQTRNQQSREFIGLDSKSVPLYDRGYSLEGGSEMTDASRCFNCGSYDHSLKECPKPRDNLAVNNARKQHKSRRNQKNSSRNPTRYYQNSPGGKYDGLKPGVLGTETRQLLGLGELDPPPWLNRMREIGYPPGYLDPEDEDQPSGITIFVDEESKEEKEDGEILEVYHPEPPMKLSVEFPGINAPIPEKADEKRWAPGPSSSNSSRNRSHRRSNYLSEPSSSGHYHESRDFRDEGPPQSNEQRRHRDFRDDEGPPGCDHPGFSPSLSGRYSERYGGYDSPQSARSNISIPRSPSFGRTLSDRGRWSPSIHEVSPNPGPYGSAPAQYSPQNRLFSPHNYGSTSYENRGYDRWNGFNSEFSSHHRDKHDRDYHRSRR